MEISPTTTDLAAAATALSGASTSAEAQVALLKKALETESQAMTQLLQMLGVGQKLDVVA